MKLPTNCLIEGVTIVKGIKYLYTSRRFIKILRSETVTARNTGKAHPDSYRIGINLTIFLSC
jgi:hypothetical protein